MSADRPLDDTVGQQILRGVLGLLCLLLLGGGVAGAADLSQPGEPLYGTKALFEDVRLVSITDDVSRADRAMSYAADRLAEARSAVSAGQESALPAVLGNAGRRIGTAVNLVVAAGDRTAARRVDEQLATIAEDLSGLVREVAVPSSAVRALAGAVEDAQGRIAALLPAPGASTQADPAPSGPPSPAAPASSTGAIASPGTQTPSPASTSTEEPQHPTPAPTPPDAADPSAPAPQPSPAQTQPAMPAATEEPPVQAVPPAPVPPAALPPPPTVVVPEEGRPQEQGDGGVIVDILPGEQPQTVVAPGSD